MWKDLANSSTALPHRIGCLLIPHSDLLPAKNGEEQTVQFLLEVVDILLTYVRKTFDRSTKVLDFHHPPHLLEGMEGFNLELSDNPESLEQILVDCRDTLKYGVRTGKKTAGLCIEPAVSYVCACMFAQLKKPSPDTHYLEVMKSLFRQKSRRGQSW